MSERYPHLVEQKDALSVYIEALLRDEAPAPTNGETLLAEPSPAIMAPPVLMPSLVLEAQSPDPEPAHIASDDRPEWAAGSFQTLLFKVAGLKLAVPLVELSGIQPWDNEHIRSVPSAISWYLGLVNYRDHSVPVVDTAELVLPKDRLAGLSEPASRLQRIVFIDDGRWGLACDAVAEVITLEPEQVRWRSDRTKRRWLAGTVIDHMCAIIDPPAFAQMLATGMEDMPEQKSDISQENA